MLKQREGFVVCGDAYGVQLPVEETEAMKGISSIGSRIKDRFSPGVGTKESRSSLPEVAEGDPGAQRENAVPFPLPLGACMTTHIQGCQEKLNTAKEKLPFPNILEKKWLIIFLLWPFAEQLRGPFQSFDSVTTAFFGGIGPYLGN